MIHVCTQMLLGMWIFCFGSFDLIEGDNQNPFGENG
jgi:hypothetical protein